MQAIQNAWLRSNRSFPVEQTIALSIVILAGVDAHAHLIKDSVTRHSIAWLDLVETPLEEANRVARACSLDDILAVIEAMRTELNTVVDVWSRDAARPTCEEWVQWAWRTLNDARWLNPRYGEHL